MLRRKLAAVANSAEGCSDQKKSKTFKETPETPTNMSHFFHNRSSNCTIPKQLINIQLRLNESLKKLTFKPPVAYIYNPVEYAFKGNEMYVNKYCQSQKKALFLGMNPGPFGMCQTGVPFGEVKSVREWLNIEAVVDKPPSECPNRPVLGFECVRSEVSGKRFWNFLKNLCGTPEDFFRHCFVYNYCPLALLNSDGANLTPKDIKDHHQLEEICDQYFFEVLKLLQPEVIIGIGEYAEKRALLVTKSNSIKIRIIRLAHPSPRAAKNQNWSEKADKFFKENDLLKYLKK